MRSRRATSEHQEAVSRRLALLSAELAASRDRPPVEPPVVPAVEPPVESQDPADWWEDHTRVRGAARAAPAPAPEPAPEPAPVPPPWSPPPVPEPGRHASRRPGPSLAALVPETLRGRAALGSAQLTVVAVVVALGLGVTSWWVVRGDAEHPVAPLPVATPAAGATDLVPLPAAAAASPAPAAAAPGGEVVVDVAGRVRRPGIVVLDPGARVVDAIEAAGGARRGVDLSPLNLARVLVDGEQVLVGEEPAPAPAGVVPSGAGAVTGTGALVNLNTATAVELEALPQVGPVTAAAIVGWREQHGGFTAVEELLEVDGIGDATLAQIAPHVTV